MRIRSLLLLICLINVSLICQAQQADLYYVFFTHKYKTDFEPATQFSPKSIARRSAHQIPWDSTDWPVHEKFVEQVQQTGASIRYRLKWINAISIQAKPEMLESIQHLDFVHHIEPFSQQKLHLTSVPPDSTELQKRDTLLSLQRKLMQADLLRKNDLTGKGVRIALIDAGFKEVNTHPSLAHVRAQNHIIGSRNFYKSKKGIYTHSWHGLGVMGCIAGKYQERWIGMAPDAEFLLARTEHKIWEKAIEEDHWLAAAEWADSLGADIISSSLGYHTRYEYADLDGKTALVSRAAAQAARKGMLVITSAGNEGVKKWRYITAPSDAPEVLAVGGTLPILPQRIPFSSYGPNALGQIKPNVSAPAYVLVPQLKGEFTISQGTSFAAPIVTGLAACLMEKFPNHSHLQIFQLIEEMGHLYPYYDYAHGYGVPQVKKLFSPEKDSLMAFETELQGGKVTVRFSPVIIADSAAAPYGRMLYYHFELPDGSLDSYEHRVVPKQARGYQFEFDPRAKGILRIWFGGQMWEKKIE